VVTALETRTRVDKLEGEQFHHQALRVSAGVPVVLQVCQLDGNAAARATQGAQNKQVMGQRKERVTFRHDES